MATLTVKQSGGDYTTLAAAVAAAANSDIIEISGSWSVADTTSVSVAVRNLIIRAVGDSKHPGYPVAVPSYYRLVVSSTTNAIELVDNYGTFEVDGLAIQLDSASAISGITMSVSGGNLTSQIKNCLIYSDGVVAGQRGVRIYNSTTVRTITSTIENCIVYNMGRSGIYFGGEGGDTLISVLNVNSCTVYNCGEYDEEGGVHNYKNLIGQRHELNIYNTVSLGNTGGDFSLSGAYAESHNVWDIHNSIASDTSIASRDTSAFSCLASRTATDSASPGAGDWVIFENKTTSPYDLRLKDNATDNDAQQMHTSGSGAGLTMPTTDIVGTNRPQGTNYDCGAFEVVPVSGPATPKNLQGTPTANSILWTWEAG